MPNSEPRQLILKPQDLALAIKLAVNKDRDFGIAELATELCMALSSVHGAIVRCEQARLLSRSTGSTRAIRPAVSEFVIHGAKYAFPGQLGASTRGTVTGIGGPVLRTHFEHAEQFAPVWPDPTGVSRGPSLNPLYPALPEAAKGDQAFYEILTLLDALRVGAARERELAVEAIEERLA